jgi:hypothetical protein
MDVQ